MAEMMDTEKADEMLVLADEVEATRRRRLGGDSASWTCRRLVQSVDAGMGGNLCTGPWLEWSLYVLTLATVMLGVGTLNVLDTLTPNHTGDLVSSGARVVDGIVSIWRPELRAAAIGCLVKIFSGLGSFTLGALLQGQLGNSIGHRKKGWVVATVALQTLALSGGNVVLMKGASHTWALVLMCAAGGSQMAMTRTLGIREITTCVFTGPWVDLLIDPHLRYFWRHVPSLRRARMMAAMLLGGTSGGIFLCVGGKMAPLWAAFAVRVVFWLAMVFAPVEQVLPN